MRQSFAACLYIVDRDTGYVLLCSHRKLHLWLPPGGEREGDERPQETAIREAHEETGIPREVLVWGRWPEFTSAPMSPHGLLCYGEYPAGDKGLHLNHSFVCVLATLPWQLIHANPEGNTFRNVCPTDPIGNTTPNVRWCLNEISNWWLRTYRGKV